MSTVLSFRQRTHSVAVRLADAIRKDYPLPEWLSDEGYSAVGMRRPMPGDYFYCPVRDRVLRCIDDVEKHPFVILEWRGRPA